jgi:hypothetical protein
MSLYHKDMLNLIYYKLIESIPTNAQFFIYLA